MSSSLSSKASTLVTCILTLLNGLQGAWLLVARVFVAIIFFKSGLTKIEDVENTVVLFEYEYAVPLISPYWAALSATFFELVSPILLIVGLCARGAALPLLVMTAVIQFTYQAHDQHYMWALLLSAIVVFGAGGLSIDACIKRRFYKNRATPV